MSAAPGQHLVKRHLKVLEAESGGDLESLCSHCGACCYAKVEVDGAPVVIKSLRCKYLAFDDAGQSRCTVYGDRRRKAPWCKSLELGIEARIFPQECPYVATLGDYTGPRALDAAAYREAESKVRAKLRGKPPEAWADPAAWAAFLSGGSR